MVHLIIEIGCFETKSNFELHIDQYFVTCYCFAYLSKYIFFNLQIAIKFNVFFQLILCDSHLASSLVLHHLAWF